MESTVVVVGEVKFTHSMYSNCKAHEQNKCHNVFIVSSYYIDALLYNSMGRVSLCSSLFCST